MQKKLLFFTALSLMAMQACKKSIAPTHEEPASTELQIKTDRAVFKSEKDYSLFWTQPDEQQKTFLNSLQNNAEFTSLPESQKGGNLNTRQKTKGCVIPKDVLEANSDFFSLLNSDGVIQIGGNVFRIDYCNKAGYLISSTAAQDAATYEDFLAGKTTNPEVRSFSLDVDVLEMVEQQGLRTVPGTTGTASTQRAAAADGGALHEWKYFKDMEDAESDASNTRMDGKINYDKFAIYFNLYAKEKYQRTSELVSWITTTSGTRQWRVEYNYRYVRKGRSEVSSSGTLNPPFGGENKVERTIYEGSRGLERYDVRWDVWNYTNNHKIYRHEGGTPVTIHFGDFVASDGQPIDVANYFWNTNIQYSPPNYYQMISGY